MRCASKEQGATSWSLPPLGPCSRSPAARAWRCGCPRPGAGCQAPPCPQCSPRTQVDLRSIPVASTYRWRDHPAILPRRYGWSAFHIRSEAEMTICSTFKEHFHLKEHGCCIIAYCCFLLLIRLHTVCFCMQEHNTPKATVWQRHCCTHAAIEPPSAPTLCVGVTWPAPQHTAAAGAKCRHALRQPQLPPAVC